MARKHRKSKSSQQRHKIRQRNLAWLWVSIGAVLIVLVGILLLSNQSSAAVEISSAQAYTKFQQGAFFLDIRSQEEWEQLHISGSTLIPLDELQNRLDELPSDQDIVVVCLSGHRSQSGIVILQEAGFTRLSCLRGGLQAWMDANYPIEQGAP